MTSKQYKQCIQKLLFNSTLLHINEIEKKNIDEQIQVILQTVAQRINTFHEIIYFD